MGEYAAELERAHEEFSAWLKNNAELKNGSTLTRSALESCPYLQNSVVGSFFDGELRRRNEINLPTALESIEKLDDIYWFFVTSCGFSLIEQAAHRAANQVDHGDEVSLVPIATCA
jgi:hypothetical protein